MSDRRNTGEKGKVTFLSIRSHGCGIWFQQFRQVRHSLTYRKTACEERILSQAVFWDPDSW